MDVVSVAPKVGTIPETKLLFTSLNVMVTVEVATVLATTGPVPVIVELAATAGPAIKVTVPSDFITGVAMERVLISAFRELKVHVETPEVSELVHPL